VRSANQNPKTRAHTRPFSARTTGANQRCVPCILAAFPIWRRHRRPEARGNLHAAARYSRAGRPRPPTTKSNLIDVKETWPASIRNIPANSRFPFKTTAFAYDRKLKSITAEVIEVKQWK
jgi:hypothetical protein